MDRAPGPRGAGPAHNRGRTPRHDPGRSPGGSRRTRPLRPRRAHVGQGAEDVPGFNRGARLSREARVPVRSAAARGTVRQLHGGPGSLRGAGPLRRTFRRRDVRHVARPEGAGPARAHECEPHRSVARRPGRNPFLGDALVRLMRAAGYKVTSEYLVNDIGRQMVLLYWAVTHLPEDPSDS